MRKTLFLSSTFLILSVLLPFSYASTNIQLTDIETAIIKKDYDQARKLAKELAALNPDKKTLWEVQYYLAISDVQTAQYEEAEEILKKLINERLDENLRDKVYLGLFDTYYLKEQYTDASKIIQKLSRISPRSSFSSLIYLKMARVSLKLAQWDKAHEYLEKIVKEFSDSLEARFAKQLLEEKQYFAVQLGAFVDRKGAENLIAELGNKQQYAYIVETTDHQSTKFYRVRVGQLALLEEAQKLKAQLARLGYPTQIYP